VYFQKSTILGAASIARHWIGDGDPLIGAALETRSPDRPWAMARGPTICKLVGPRPVSKDDPKSMDADGHPASGRFIVRRADVGAAASNMGPRAGPMYKLASTWWAAHGCDANRSWTTNRLLSASLVLEAAARNCGVVAVDVPLEYSTGSQNGLMFLLDAYTAQGVHACQRTAETAGTAHESADRRANTCGLRPSGNAGKPWLLTLPAAGHGRRSRSSTLRLRGNDEYCQTIHWPVLRRFLS